MTLLHCREVPEEEAKEFAAGKDIMHFEVSAKEGTFVEEAFLKICHNLPVDNSFLVTQSQCKAFILTAVINQSQFDVASQRNGQPIQMAAKS